MATIVELIRAEMEKIGRDPNYGRAKRKKPPTMTILMPSGKEVDYRQRADGVWEMVE